MNDFGNRNDVANAHTDTLGVDDYSFERLLGGEYDFEDYLEFLKCKSKIISSGEYKSFGDFGSGKSTAQNVATNVATNIATNEVATNIATNIATNEVTANSAASEAKNSAAASVAATNSGEIAFALQCEIYKDMHFAFRGVDTFPIVFCVGSDKITGDALAPIVGSMLKKMNAPCFVYGELKNPINAKNLVQTVKFVKKMHPEKKILVVDASVGSAQHVGKVRFVQGGIVPGKAVGKDFGSVGDFAVVGVVAAKCGSSDISQTRLYDVTRMAKQIAREIYFAARDFGKKGGKLDGVWG